MSETTEPAVVAGTVANGKAEEMRDKFLKTLTDAQNRASDVNSPTKVGAKPFVQMGATCLVAACPKCHTVAGLTGEGLHLCRHCHAWLKYVREE